MTRVARSTWTAPSSPRSTLWRASVGGRTSPVSPRFGRAKSTSSTRASTWSTGRAAAAPSSSAPAPPSGARRCSSPSAFRAPSSPSATGSHSCAPTGCTATSLARRTGSMSRCAPGAAWRRATCRTGSWDKALRLPPRGSAASTSTPPRAPFGPQRWQRARSRGRRACTRWRRRTRQTSPSRGSRRPRCPPLACWQRTPTPRRPTSPQATSPCVDFRRRITGRLAPRRRSLQARHQLRLRRRRRRRRPRRRRRRRHQGHLCQACPWPIARVPL